MNILIGNIIALVASLIMVYTGILKNKKKIIYLQTVQIGLSVISNIVLGGISGAIINGISCIRNVLCYKGMLTTMFKILIVIISIILTLLFNNLGIIGLLPLISIVVYTLFMDTKKVITLKLLIIFTMIMWLLYDFYIKSYTSSLFDLLTIITNVIALNQLRNKR